MKSQFDQAFADYTNTMQTRQAQGTYDAQHHGRLLLFKLLGKLFGLLNRNKMLAWSWFFVLVGTPSLLFGMGIPLKDSLLLGLMVHLFPFGFLALIGWRYILVSPWWVNLVDRKADALLTADPTRLRFRWRDQFRVWAAFKEGRVFLLREFWFVRRIYNRKTLRKTARKSHQVLNPMLDYMGSLGPWRLVRDNLQQHIFVDDYIRPGVRRLWMKVPMGAEPKQIMAEFPAIQSHLALASVQLDTEQTTSEWIVALLCEHNYLFDTLDSTEAPSLHLRLDELHDPYLPLGIGLDTTGEVVDYQLIDPENGADRALTGGVSGAGKSSAFRNILLRAVSGSFNYLDKEGVYRPGIFDVFVADGKGTEMGYLKKYAGPHIHYAGRTVDELFNLLDQFEAEIARHQDILDASGLDKWIPELGRYVVFMLDELISYDAQFQTLKIDGRTVKEKDIFWSKMNHIGSIGRSLGVYMHFSTQRSTTDVMDSTFKKVAIETVFGYRVSDTIEADNLLFQDTKHPLSPQNIPANIPLSHDGGNQYGKPNKNSGQVTIKRGGDLRAAKCWYLPNALIVQRLDELFSHAVPDEADSFQHSSPFNAADEDWLRKVEEG